MNIYAIYCDNGMQYEDHDYSIEPSHIYTNKEKADEICLSLNNPIFSPSMTEEEFNKEAVDWYNSYEELVTNEKEEFDNPYYRVTYTVVALTVKT